MGSVLWKVGWCLPSVYNPMWNFLKLLVGSLGPSKDRSLVVNLYDLQDLSN
jgi:hypothetical protein